MVNSKLDTSDHTHEGEWAPFTTSLAICLSQLRTNQYLVLHLRNRPLRFVQFAQAGSAGFRAESVSNYYLREADRLTPEDESSLSALGWHRPVDPNDMTIEGPSNWYMSWSAPAPFSEVAKLAVNTLTVVHQAQLPTDLSYRAFDHEGTEASFPILGIAQYVPSLTYEIQTRRPLGGPVGEALASSNGQRERLVENILNRLDQGE